MATANIVQTKFDKVKSFMDNGSFVFTYSNSKPFAIHKDQLFKNQLYDTSLDDNGLPKNIRLNSPYLKHERIEKLVCTEKSVLAIMYDSKKLIVHNASLNSGNEYGYTEITLPEYYKDINGEQVLMNEKIKTFTVSDRCIYILTNMNRLFGMNVNGEVVNEENVESDDPLSRPPIDMPSISNGNSLLEINFSDTYETIANIWSGYNEQREQTGAYIYTTDNDLYFFPDDGSEKIYIGNFEYIKEIKSAYKRTFIIFKTGNVICHGHNENGELGIGFTSQQPIDNFETHLFNSVSSTDSFESSIIKMPDVYDVAIGKYHTIFLNENGYVFGFGKNTNYQLGPNNEEDFVTKFSIIKYPRASALSIKATPYGTIILGFDGKLYVNGTFVSGELSLSNNGTDLVIIDGTEYNKYFCAKKPTKISRVYDSDNSVSNLISVYYNKLFNTFGDNLFIARDNGKVYYTGQNRRKFLGDAFGLSGTISIWTSLENNSNNLLRKIDERPETWSYYFDFILKNDKQNGNALQQIFYKHENRWIDWMRYIERYVNITMKRPDGTKLPKYKYEYKYDGSVLKQYLNFDTFITYLEMNPHVVDEFAIDKRKLPSVDYIDSDLKVWKINAGDNIAYCHYTQDYIDFINRNYQESLARNNELKSQYLAIIEESDDPDEIIEYQDKLSIVEMNIADLTNAINANQEKLNKVLCDSYLDFNKSNAFNALDIVGSEEKTKTFTHTIFNEDGSVALKTVNGVTSVEKESVTKTYDENITKLKFEFVNYDHLIDSKNPNNEVLRDDIKLSIQDDPNDDREYDVDDIIVWLGGKFVNIDRMLPADNNKAFYVYNGMAGLNSRIISEFPGLGEPTLKNDDSLPSLHFENATVLEKTYPTEVRFDARMKTFGWDGVKIAGPYQIHNTDFVNSELTGKVYFYFADIYCSIFTEIKLLNQIVSKNTFMLFMNGAVLSEDEYDVYHKDGNTIIKLKTFTDYVVSLLQDYVDISKPGHVGKIKYILGLFDDLQPFSIAFLRSTEKYKKVKLFYDYQNVRNYPKPGQILFNDVKYNDLILIDGFYTPYIWESQNCIRIPETLETVRSSENNFMNHSSIYKIRPYTTYKEEYELTDKECRDYAYDVGIINDLEYNTMEIGIVRNLVKNHITSRIKDI